MTSPASRWVLGVALASAVMILVAGVTVAGPSRGPVPKEAFPERGGPVNQALLPDFIPALDRAGNEVGWVSKNDAMPVVDAGDRRLIRVYDDDLSTLVGHMVAGYGFAPLGTNLEPLLNALPTIPPGIPAEMP